MNMEFSESLSTKYLLNQGFITQNDEGDCVTKKEKTSSKGQTLARHLVTKARTGMCSSWAEELPPGTCAC